MIYSYFLVKDDVSSLSCSEQKKRLLLKAIVIFSIILKLGLHASHGRAAAFRSLRLFARLHLIVGAKYPARG